MSGKGAVSLVEGYWPTSVPRYLQIPGLSVSEAIVTRPARRRSAHAAIVADGTVTTYQDLAEEVERAACALRAAASKDPLRVVIAPSAPGDLLVSFLAAMRIGSAVLVLDDATAGVEARLATFRPDVVVAQEPVASAQWRTLAPAELRAFAATAAAPQPRIDLRAPMIAFVGSDGRVVQHSHATVLAWAVSFSAFVPLTESSTVVPCGPLARWGDLTAALAILFRGGTCVLGSRSAIVSGDDLPDAVAGRRQGVYATAPLEALTEALPHARRSPLADAGVEGIFAFVDHAFHIRQRRAIEAALGAPVLTVVGGAASGPVIASHPTWYLPEAAGIPVTNIDLWPLDPGSGEPLLVPWEAIDYGELGVRSPLTAVGYEAPEDRERRVHSGWLRMDAVATMDPNGLFYLRS